MLKCQQVKSPIAQAIELFLNKMVDSIYFSSVLFESVPPGKRDVDSICIFATGENRGSTASSRSGQRSSALLLHMFESTTIPHQTKNQTFRSGLFGGGWWIRTTEGIASRFTVCPLWPLGKSPIFDFCFRLLGAGRRTRTPDLLITNQLLYQLSYTGGSNRTCLL